LWPLGCGGERVGEGGAEGGERECGWKTGVRVG
jgi:hypothetical protein